MEFLDLDTLSIIALAVSIAAFFWRLEARITKMDSERGEEHVALMEAVKLLIEGGTEQAKVIERLGRYNAIEHTKLLERMDSLEKAVDRIERKA